MLYVCFLHCMNLFSSRLRNSNFNVLLILTDINIDLLFALGLSFDRPKKQRKERAEPDPEEKRKYQEEANQFAMSLVEGLGDQDGKASCKCTQQCWPTTPNIVGC